MRMQPQDIETPAGDPFAHDLLDRRETVETLTGVLCSVEGPCVVSLDAAWGAGKTTFLKIWEQYLRDKKFPVVSFNAWETDFAEEPFVALSTELKNGLEACVEECGDKSLNPKIESLWEGAKKIAPSLASGIIGSVVPGAGEVLGQAIASLVEERMNGYEETRKSMKEFRHTLREAAKTLAEARPGPLVVMIDELDRCRPSYAVALLEVAKHLFAVDGIVFVLAVNRSQLAHSVKALYGEGFDGEEYLGRFFDLDFRLPEPDRTKFVEAMIEQTGIKDVLKPGRKARQSQELLQVFFGAPGLSIRHAAQAIHHLGLVLGSVREGEPHFALTTTALLILRTFDMDMYRRFVDGDASDKEVVDAVSERSGIKALAGEEGGVLFRAMIMVLDDDRAGTARRGEEGFSKSVILSRLREGGELERADDIRLEAVRLGREFSTPADSVGFKESVRRIELLSSVLVEGEA